MSSPATIEHVVKQGESWTYSFVYANTVQFQIWGASTTYAVNSVVAPVGTDPLDPDEDVVYFRATAITSGVSGTSQPSRFKTATPGQSVVDNGVTWVCQLTSSVPQDLTGATGQSQFRRAIDASGSPSVDMTTSNGMMSLGTTDGTVTLGPIPAATTRALVSSLATPPYPTYVHDCFVTLANGRVMALIEGDVIVKPGVTHP